MSAGEARRRAKRDEGREAVRGGDWTGYDVRQRRREGGPSTRRDVMHTLIITGGVGRPSAASKAVLHGQMVEIYRRVHVKTTLCPCGGTTTAV